MLDDFKIDIKVDDFKPEEISRSEPLYYCFLDGNYRKLPNKEVIRFYLNDQIYFLMAEFHA